MNTLRRHFFRRWARLLLLAGCVASLDAGQANEVRAWRGIPIPVVLNVGEERVLVFPDNVQVGVPPALTAGQFRTQSTGGTALWLAHEPFDTQRLQIRLIGSGQLMLFDVTAVAASTALPSEPLRIVTAETGDRSAAFLANDHELTHVRLTRFAARQLYAPERLLQDLPGVRRVPMGVSRSVALFRHDQIKVTPLASWQGGALYVTAVKLENQGQQRLFLDPRELEGRFVTATFQHNSLGAARSWSDTTVVYLVTDRPFAASIFSGAFDAGVENASED